MNDKLKAIQVKALWKIKDINTETFPTWYWHMLLSDATC